MTRFAVLLAVLILAGCGSVPGPDVVKTVNVAVPVRCDKAQLHMEAKPDFPDTDAKLKATKPGEEGFYDRVKAIAAGRLLHFHWEDVLEKALNACTAEVPAPTPAPAAPTPPPPEKLPWWKRVF